ncbi:C13 family peptidase [Ramlibacter sp. PS3R-8]|uniref:C13 family peptidase n=1 Tax=Ramlibacter sp. PS3R-8 TaxID=3133437 RepID=UPI0030A67ABC
MNDTVHGEAAPPAAARDAALGVGAWLREGLRAAVLLRPKGVAGASPRVHELFVLTLIAVTIELALGRLEVPGPAQFNVRAWLGSWWTVSGLVFLLWALLPRREADRPSGLASWLALWLVASLVPGLVSQVLGALHARDLLPGVLADSGAFAWLAYVTLLTWTLAIAVRLASAFGVHARGLASLFAGLLVIFGLTAWQFTDRPWEPIAQAPEPPPGLTLSQETIETQQVVLQRALDQVAAERPGVTDVYGIVFAPYGEEDVFRRESAMVAGVLAQRFDAQGRVLQLVNHVDTAETLPWATPLNLKRAIAAVAKRMDRERDLLVVYLTSHGAGDFQLAASNPPLQVDTVSPGELRAALDEAGIRNRVIAISACFSGGWVGPLASESTLVMTAADADHTSYGCGKLSDLTFFGRALFDEQLRKTHSFERAFAAAVPLIRRRENEAGKQDGFSNPQISIGERVRPLLAELEKRLDGLPAASRP